MHIARILAGKQGSCPTVLGIGVHSTSGRDACGGGDEQSTCVGSNMTRGGAGKAAKRAKAHGTLSCTQVYLPCTNHIPCPSYILGSQGAELEIALVGVDADVPTTAVALPQSFTGGIDGKVGGQVNGRACLEKHMTPTPNLAINVVAEIAGGHPRTGRGDTAIGGLNGYIAPVSTCKGDVGFHDGCKGGKGDVACLGRERHIA